MRYLNFTWLLLYFFGANAQNWKPISQNEKLNYSTDEAIPFSTIWVDSAILGNNGDSIYYLNRIIQKCDECPNPNNYEDYYLLNRPSFLLSEIILKQDGSFLMQHESNRYYIDPFETFNTPWVFDSASNKTAKIIYASDSLIFGIPDSIKYVELSDSNNIIISKNNGVLKFPLFNTDKQHGYLIGNEGRNLGFMTPYFDDIYDFNIGDLFEYYITSGAHFPGPKINQQYSVLNKSISLDTIRYFISVKERTVLYYVYTPYDTTYATYLDTLEFINVPYHFLNKNLNQILDDTINCGSKYKPVLAGYDSTFLTDIKYYPGRKFLKKNGDTVLATPNPGLGCVPEWIEIYGRGVGLIIVSENDGLFPYPQYYEKKLIGCKINGQTYGVLSPEYIFNSVSPNDIVENIITYPNPFTKEINIFIPDSLTFDYALISFTGQTIRKGNFFYGNNKLCLNGFPTGFYYLKISCNEYSIYKKILKLQY